MSEPASLYARINIKPGQYEKFLATTPANPHHQPGWQQWWDGLEMYGKIPVEKVLQAVTESSNAAWLNAWLKYPSAAAFSNYDANTQTWRLGIVQFSENYMEMLPLLAALRGVAEFKEMDDSDYILVFPYLWTNENDPVVHLKFTGDNSVFLNECSGADWQEAKEYLDDQLESSMADAVLNNDTESASQQKPYQETLSITGTSSTAEQRRQQMQELRNAVYSNPNVDYAFVERQAISLKNLAVTQEEFEWALEMYQYLETGLARYIQMADEKAGENVLQLYQRNRMLSQKYKWDEIPDAIEKVVLKYNQLSYDRFNVYHGLAHCYRQLKNYPQAIECLLKAFEYYNSVAYFITELANLYALNNEPEKAETVLRQSNHGTNKPDLYINAYFLIKYARQGDWVRALDYFFIMQAILLPVGESLTKFYFKAGPRQDKHGNPLTDVASYAYLMDSLSFFEEAANDFHRQFLQMMDGDLKPVIALLKDKVQSGTATIEERKLYCIIAFLVSKNKPSQFLKQTIADTSVLLPEDFLLTNMQTEGQRWQHLERSLVDHLYSYYDEQNHPS